MLLPPSRLARGGPAFRNDAKPPTPFSPWQAEHLFWKIGAPCAGVPLPAGRPVPSGMMLMSQGAISASVIGLPRLGPSAANAPALTTRQAAAKTTSRIDMADFPLVIDGPAGDRVEMLAREGKHRGRCRGLSANFDEVGARWLCGAGFVPRPALQNCRLPIPAPRHAEAREGLGQDRLLQCRLAPALAAVGRHHHLHDAARSRIGD